MQPVDSFNGARVWRVMICDDSPIERLALGHFLRAEGYDVDEVGDGESAMAQLKLREVDLVLLDLQMPDVDGFDVLNYLHEHRRGLKVILLSGMPPDLIQDRMGNLRSGELPPMLLKPIDPQQLLDVMEMRLSDELPPIGDEITPTFPMIE